MRKVTSKHGNVGEAGKDFDSEKKRRCNVCDFCNVIDGYRVMTRDKLDPTGGYICSKCKPSPFGHEKDSWKREDWYAEAIEASRHSVDGQRTYDEMVENLITQWERDNDR